MSKERLPRKLAAILYADVAGYSRLTGEDEEGTHRRLSSSLDAISSAIESHDGRVVHYAGDAVLAEFPTVSEALGCAIGIQQTLSEKSRDVPPEKRVLFRIGLNMGEVIVDRGDIYGDGVNVAARLEALADPGGICVSEAVRSGVGRKLPVSFEFMGEQLVKNIAEPVRAYHVVPSGRSEATPAGGAERDRGAAEKPSIAVLPFANMSADPEQSYFSDGITEDIITELSRFRSLLVIARNSSFSFRDQGLGVRDVGRRLGVRYLVEDSVRKAGRRVRVTVQLVDAASGLQLWAERYDRQLEDIFAVQDEITQAIVATLPGRLEDAGWHSARRKTPASMTAYDHVLVGLERFNRFTSENNAQARVCFRRAVEIDPDYARAHALLGVTHVWDAMMGSGREGRLAEAIGSIEKALSLDDNDAWTHGVFGLLLFMREADERAEAHLRRAVSLNANDADAAAFMCNFLVYMGQCDEALDWIDKAMRLNPFPPSVYHWYRALALFSARRYDQAAKAIKKITPMLRWGHGYLAACYARTNRPTDAQRELSAFVAATQKALQNGAEPARPVTVDVALERAARYRNPADGAHFLDGLRKAGLPD